nr:splicing factor, proline- and glutamine-rich-like [Equus asinus]
MKLQRQGRFQGPSGNRTSGNLWGHTCASLEPLLYPPDQTKPSKGTRPGDIPPSIPSIFAFCLLSLASFLRLSRSPSFPPPAFGPAPALPASLPFPPPPFWGRHLSAAQGASEASPRSASSGEAGPGSRGSRLRLGAALRKGPPPGLAGRVEPAWLARESRRGPEGSAGRDAPRRQRGQRSLGRARGATEKLWKYAGIETPLAHMTPPREKQPRVTGHRGQQKLGRWLGAAAAGTQCLGGLLCKERSRDATFLKFHKASSCTQVPGAGDKQN